MESLKILIFDDTQQQREAAAAQLKEHALTIVGTYDDAQKALTEMSPDDPFDVVLTDLLVPPSEQALSGSAKKEWKNQEMPLGSIIALLALKVGVKKVGVVSNENHHLHPASAALDCFRRLNQSEPDGIRVHCSNNAVSVVLESTLEPVGQTDGPMRIRRSEDKTVDVKGWEEVLVELTKE